MLFTAKTNKSIKLLLLWLVYATIAACSSNGNGVGSTSSYLPVQWSNPSKDSVIVGTVVDQLGNPVPQVAVYFPQCPVSLVNYTDNNGKFTISNYPLGKQEVRFEKFGYITVSENVQLATTGHEIGNIKLYFGDANNDGSINAYDITSYERIVGLTVNNTNCFMDYNGNNHIDVLDFYPVLNGSGARGVQYSEWLVSRPDYVTYIPAYSRNKLFTTNQHYFVTALSNGRLFGIWTGASTEAADNQSVLCHWSDNGGKTWSDFNLIAGLDGKIASYGFSIYVPEKNRLYVFYNRDFGTRIYLQGYLAMKYSDDGGQSWSHEFRYSFEPGEYTPKNPAIPPYWWVYQNPIKVGDKFMVGFTEILPHEPDEFYSTEIRFLCFDNIMSIDNPDDLIISTLPEHGQTGLRWPSSDRSQLQEPSLVQLSDGRLFCVMRSSVGTPFYSVSSDGGKTWMAPAVLRYGDGQPQIDQPWAPCPIYKLGSTSYVLISNNNAGNANGGVSPSDILKNRTPSFVLYAQEDLANQQPLTFSRPIKFLENYVRPYGPDNRTEIGTYPSFTIINGSPTLWYADRKHFLLGKRLPLQN